MNRVSRHGLVILPGLLALIAVLACTPGEPTGPMQVVMRLGPDQFEDVPAPFHGAVAPIGEEARPAIVAPKSQRVVSALALAAGDDGRVVAEVELPADVRSMPTAAFTLQVQRLPGVATAELLAQMSRTILSRQVLEGWRLERGDAGNATLIYRHDDPVGTHRYSLHLHVLHPGPSHLRSRTFDAPRGASLELAYGLTTVPGAAGFVPAAFEAELDCEGERPRRVVDDRIAGADAGGWRDASVALPRGGGPCRLDLTASGPGGESILGAVWAVPRIVAPGPPETAARPNVVMISLDTLRADHLSGFGYARETSPRIDAQLIAPGTHFRDVTSTYSRTDVSHMSLFTGLYPEARPERGRLQPHTPVPTFAERLRDAGFDTAAFTEDGLLAGSFGFWFGFDRYKESAYRHEERAAPILADGLGYLRGLRGREEPPFFLFLHTYKTHAPYYASPPYQELFRGETDWDALGTNTIPEPHRAVADEYDRTIREADDFVGDLLAELDALGLAANTLVVLLSDHGEAFGEHGVLGHSFSGHQEVLRVPLILRGPGVPEGLAVDAPVSLVDVVPTLLDLLDLPAPQTTQGVSLVPALRGETLSTKRGLYFSWLAKGATGVRYGSYKYRRSAGRRALFDLEADPGETSPISGPRSRPIAERLLSDHEAASAAIREALERDAPTTAAEEPPVSPEMEEALRELGYIE